MVKSLAAFGTFFLICLGLSSYGLACSSSLECGLGEKCVKPGGSSAFSNDGQCINTGGREMELTKSCDSNLDCNSGYKCTASFGNGVCVKSGY